MSGDDTLIRRLLAGLSVGDPMSYAVVAIAVAAVAYAMWRLIRAEDPPVTGGDWVRLIAIVAAGAGAIIGILGLVAAVSFAAEAGQHAALFGSAVFFTGFLVALVSLSVDVRSELRERRNSD